MKFYCDKCQTKYSIADEKIAGKVLKVRCKKCAHVITVREPTAPVNSAAQAVRSAKGPTPPPSPARVQWYYSVNGETIGPFALHVIQRMFARGELGDGVHVWNESFTAWKPVFEVSEFRASLEQALKVRPKAQTLGISQALEAIQNDDNRIHANAAVAKTVQEDREPFAENDQSLARASASVDPAPSKVAADKLDTFVEEDGPAVLKGKEPAMAAQAPKKPLPGLFSKGPRTLEQGAVEAPQATGRSERLEKLRERLRGSDEMSDGRRQEELDVALGDTVDAGNDGALNELASPDGSAELEALGTESVHDGLFSERGSA